MHPELKIAIYADGADVRDMIAARDAGTVKGFTTNPTLMRKTGITDYEAFAKEALSAVGGMPISFEVFADDFAEMERQAQADRHLGRARVREDPDHEHARGVRGPAHRDALRRPA